MRARRQSEGGVVAIMMALSLGFFSFLVLGALQMQWHALQTQRARRMGEAMAMADGDQALNTPWDGSSAFNSTLYKTPMSTGLSRAELSKDFGTNGPNTFATAEFSVVRDHPTLLGADGKYQTLTDRRMQVNYNTSLFDQVPFGQVMQTRKYVATVKTYQTSSIVLVPWTVYLLLDRTSSMSLPALGASDSDQVFLTALKAFENLVGQRAYTGRVNWGAAWLTDRASFNNAAKFTSSIRPLSPDEAVVPARLEAQTAAVLKGLEEARAHPYVGQKTNMSWALNHMLQEFRPPGSSEGLNRAPNTILMITDGWATEANSAETVGYTTYKQGVIESETQTPGQVQRYMNGTPLISELLPIFIQRKTAGEVLNGGPRLFLSGLSYPLNLATLVAPQDPTNDRASVPIIEPTTDPSSFALEKHIQILNQCQVSIPAATLGISDLDWSEGRVHLYWVSTAPGGKSNMERPERPVTLLSPAQSQLLETNDDSAYVQPDASEFYVTPGGSAVGERPPVSLYDAKLFPPKAIYLPASKTFKLRWSMCMEWFVWNFLNGVGVYNHPGAAAQLPPALRIRWSVPSISECSDTSIAAGNGACR